MQNRAALLAGALWPCIAGTECPCKCFGFSLGLSEFLVQRELEHLKCFEQVLSLDISVLMGAIVAHVSQRLKEFRKVGPLSLESANPS